MDAPANLLSPRIAANGNMTDTKFHETPEETAHPRRKGSPSPGTSPETAKAASQSPEDPANGEKASPAAADADAPLDIPWGKVVLYLVVAWAVFRFAWLVFESGG